MERVTSLSGIIAMLPDLTIAEMDQLRGELAAERGRKVALLGALSARRAEERHADLVAARVRSGLPVPAVVPVPESGDWAARYEGEAVLQGMDGPPVRCGGVRVLDGADALARVKAVQRVQADMAAGLDTDAQEGE